MILVIGTEQDVHSKYICTELQKRKIDVSYLDSFDYPDKIFLSYTPDGKGNIVIDNKKINLDDIQGVYWRWYNGIKFSTIDVGENTEFVSNMVFRERRSAFESFLHILDKKSNLVNSLEAVNMHKVKTFQLHLMLTNNIKVPKTMITNDIEILRQFYEENNKNVIYKPVLGGAYTKKLDESDFSKENLETLKTSPVQLQECVDGVDIRVYTMNNKTFAGQILADTLDFRESEKGVETVELPEKVSADCFKILDLLKLKYSGIDVRKTPNNEYVFIEANPAPMFMSFEKRTGYPITENLIELLLK